MLRGEGTVGGMRLNYEGVAKHRVEVSLRLVAGENPKAIPSSPLRNVTTFDWRELGRWGVAESRLPAGSIVLYKEFSVWELYKWRIIGVISLCILEALLIVGLLISRAKRKQAQRESQRFG